MDTQSLNSQPGIATEAYSPDFICRLHDVAKRITQLKKTGDNFSVWERELKVMIRNISGSTDYLQQEFHKFDPKLNQVIFNLIFWSIDQELQQDLNLDGSAGDAFQALMGRFQSNHSNRCIIGRADFPKEVLDNIVNMVYYQSYYPQNCLIEERKQALVVQDSLQGLSYEVYLDHSGPPILNTFQNLAVVNRRFHRLCLPKLWQHIRFPSALPAPIALWTNNILLRHGRLVKSLEVTLEDDRLVGDIHEFGSKRSSYDNTGVILELQHGVGSYREKYGIGLYNVEKLFKACPSLVSVSIMVPESSRGHEEWMSHITTSLHLPFRSAPQLQDLRLGHCAGDSITSEDVVKILQQLPSLVSLELAGFEFRQRPAIGVEWSLGQQQTLRKLRLECVTDFDGTWTLFNSWPPQLENLTVDCCDGLSPRVLHTLLSGSAPSLTKLHLILDLFADEPDVTVRFDLPALKELSIRHLGDLDLLLSFENCKSVETLKYQSRADDEEWHLMRQYLSRPTWPNLSVLDFRTSIFTVNRKKPAKMDVNEIWNSFKIKLLIDDQANEEAD